MFVLDNLWKRHALWNHEKMFGNMSVKQFVKEAEFKEETAKRKK